jgi:hypothetical protein
MDAAALAVVGAGDNVSWPTMSAKTVSDLLEERFARVDAWLGLRFNLLKFVYKMT